MPTPGGYAYVLSQSTVAALAPGFSLVTIGRADSSARVDLGAVTFNNPTLVQSPQAGGSINLLAGYTVTVSGANPATFAAGTGSAGLFSMAAAAVLAAGTGTVTVEADAISLASGAGTITGRGTLILEPETAAEAIVVGQSGTTSQFVLTSAELLVPAAGFANVYVGRANGSGAISVYAASLNNPYTFQAPASGGSVTFNGTVTTTLAGDNLTATAGGSISVLANLTIGVSGSIALNADAVGTGAGAVAIGQSGTSVLFTPQGAISASGQAITIGTSSAHSELITPNGNLTLTVDVNGTGGGALTINNASTQLKAGGNLLITTPGSALEPTTLISLAGQVQAVGTLTVVSDNSVAASTLQLLALGAVSFQAAGSITLSSGRLTSQNATLMLVADSGHAGAGTLTLANSSQNVLVSSGSSLTLSGESVSVGSATGFAWLYSFAGNLNILADYSLPGHGTFLFNNAQSLITAGGNLQIGDPSFGVGTPYSVAIDVGTIKLGGALSILSLTNVLFDVASVNALQNILVQADQSIQIDGGNLLTNGTQLSLLADLNTASQGTITIDQRAFLQVGLGTLTLSAYTVSVDPSVTVVAATTNIIHH